MEELTELDITELATPIPETTNLSRNGSNGSGAAHGTGLELLMNNSSRSKVVSQDIDIDKMESELNQMSSGVFNSEDISSKGHHSPSVAFIEEPTYHQPVSEEHSSETPPMPSASMFTPRATTPPAKESSSSSRTPTENTLREKKKYIKLLEGLQKRGEVLSKRFTTADSLVEIMDEYELIVDQKKRKAAVAWQGQALVAVVNGIEFLNGRFDPFDIKLEGLSDQIQENLTDYDDIFSELYDKYFQTSTSPELKLLMNIVGSATMVHISNSMFKSAIPGADAIFRENPDLFQSFQAAAMKSMSQTAPGFTNFVSQTSGGVSGYSPPRQTQVPSPPAMFSRPDLSASVGSVPLQDPEPPRKSHRAEMRGPENLTSILSGVKTRTIDIQKTQTTAGRSDASTISLEELRDIAPMAKMPKKSNRRNRSNNSNTISLDI